jgi:ubiquinone/menaquinone biosynthesis C-methylase UbiE
MTLNNTLCISPLPENIQNVLDVGTGTGIWAIDFATEHPTAQVTGVDLSPIQPSMVPPNCTFIVDNIEQEWVYDKKFDLVHGRLLLMGIHDWPKLIRQAWDNTKPGGWIELQEGQFPLLCDDGSAGPDSPVVQWSKYLQQASQKVGLDSKGNEKFTEYLTAQGYTNLRVESLKWAIGGWPKGKKEKEIGKWTLENFLQGLSGVSMALFTRHLGWSREAVEVYLIEVRKHAKDLSSHVYFPM